jgi:hypothetical protein
MLKNGELLLEIEDRDCYFWGQDDHMLHTHPTGEEFIFPDWAYIFEGGRDHLQHADPSGDAGQVAQEIIARLELLHGLPPSFAEPGDVSTGIEELLPGRPRKQIQPILPYRHDPHLVPSLRRALGVSKPLKTVIFPPAHAIHIEAASAILSCSLSTLYDDSVLPGDPPVLGRRKATMTDEI